MEEGRYLEKDLSTVSKERGAIDAGQATKNAHYRVTSDKRYFL